MTDKEFKSAIGTKDGFSAAVATPDGKEIVAKVVAELFPHIPKILGGNNENT